MTTFLFIQKKALFTFLVPLLFFLGLLISYKTQTILGFGNLALGILGCLAALIGILIATWGFLSLGSSFAVFPKAIKLKTGGAYRFFRHPIYVGMDLMYLGLAIGLGSLPGFLYNLLIIVPLNIYRARQEEKELEKKFGKDYLEYKKTTIV